MTPGSVSCSRYRHGTRWAAVASTVVLALAIADPAAAWHPAALDARKARRAADRYAWKAADRHDAYGKSIWVERVSCRQRVRWRIDCLYDAMVRNSGVFWNEEECTIRIRVEARHNHKRRQVRLRFRETASTCP